MKKKRYLYRTCLLLMTALAACSESYFDRYPDDQFTEGVFYNSEQDFIEAVNSIYSAQRGHYRRFYAIADVSSDDAYNYKGNNNLNATTINESTIFSDNVYIKDFWEAGYRVIARANIVLDRIERVNMDTGRKNQFVGEARFLRAMTYFNLVRIFGDVPLVTSELRTASEAFNFGRENTTSVYTSIIQDLQEAIHFLPDDYPTDIDQGRATKVAAKTMLGKVYLTQKNYSAALSILEEVIQSPKAYLLDNYEDIFNPDNPNNAEIIFAVQYMRNIPGQGSGWGNDAAPNIPIGRVVVRGGGGGSFHITRDLYRAFENGDRRLTMVDSAHATTGGRRFYWTKKYIDPEMLTANSAANDWIVLRYADVLLMAAEALNELGRGIEAETYLNDVRNRAGLEDITNLSQVDMRAVIAQERRVELNCEGHRWFELLRSGNLKEIMNKHFTDYRDDDHEVGQNSVIEDHELVFPLPKDQVDLNPSKLPQNKGY